MGKKISQMTARNTSMTENDWIEIAEDNGGGTWVTKKVKKSIILGYKSFAFKITQEGTDAPSLNILNNDLSITPPSSYFAVGQYKIDLTGVGASSASKIAVLISRDGVNGGMSGYNVPDANTVNLETLTLANTYSNDIFYETFCEIRIYY